MKLHTSLDADGVRHALMRAKSQGHITHDVQFTVFSVAGSRSRDRAFEIQLGTEDKYSLPEGYHNQKVRRFKNSGHSGASRIYSATWDEWGWFISEIFGLDPDAVFREYSSRKDFDEKTAYLFAEGS